MFASGGDAIADRAGPSYCTLAEATLRRGKTVKAMTGAGTVEDRSGIRVVVARSLSTSRPSSGVTCGSRTIIDAVFGPISVGETRYAPRLLSGLRPGMLLLADRNFAVTTLARQVSAGPHPGQCPDSSRGVEQEGAEAGVWVRRGAVVGEPAVRGPIAVRADRVRLEQPKVTLPGTRNQQ
ncbi:hypothetical protein AB0F52_08945 [Amycolatopsis sp. NPDC024027]|uniref:hypothetical protein n=1 Tax=Amycolatopsis sp. NPDC024027 TaxID=3154327 RepID=UPI0033DA5164